MAHLHGDLLVPLVVDAGHAVNRHLPKVGHGLLLVRRRPEGAGVEAALYPGEAREPPESNREAAREQWWPV